MRHPVLGDLATDEQSPRSLKGQIPYGARKLKLRIDPDSAPLDEAISLAVGIATSLPTIDVLAKTAIINDLLDSYNSGWNEYERARGDGTFESVRNPKLVPDEFRSKFTLDAIQIYGDSCVQLWYDDSGLFWGHSIFVTSFKGVDFSEAEAQMFG